MSFDGTGFFFRPKSIVKKQRPCNWNYHFLKYLIQFIEHPILWIPNFNFPNLRCFKVFFSFQYNELYWHFWGYFDINLKLVHIWKKYSKSKPSKYLGFVKWGVRWAEQDKMSFDRRNFETNSAKIYCKKATTLQLKLSSKKGL